MRCVGGMLVAGTLLSIFAGQLVQGQLEKQLQEYRDIVKTLATRAEAAYKERCAELPNCGCIHNDCAFNTTGFTCGTVLKASAGVSDACKAACSNAENGLLAGYKYSTARVPSHVSMTREVSETLCYASKLDATFIANQARKPSLRWQ